MQGVRRKPLLKLLLAACVPPQDANELLTKKTHDNDSACANASNDSDSANASDDSIMAMSREQLRAARLLYLNKQKRLPSKTQKSRVNAAVQESSGIKSATSLQSMSSFESDIRLAASNKGKHTLASVPMVAVDTRVRLHGLNAAVYHNGKVRLNISYICMNTIRNFEIYFIRT